jgi:hypothetical protein
MRVITIAELKRGLNDAIRTALGSANAYPKMRPTNAALGAISVAVEKYLTDVANGEPSADLLTNPATGRKH